MKRLVAALLLPALFATGALARELPPKPGAPRDFVLPAKETVRFDNGLSVTFLDFGRVPKVTLMAVVRTGSIDEGEDTWLSDLTVEMMKEGTTSRTSAEIARRAAEMGGNLGVGAGAEQTSVGISVLSEHAAEAAALVADVLRNPAFPADQFPRLVANHERNLSVALSSAGALAGEALARLAYGDHPFGRTLPKPGQLATYTLDDIRGFHAGQFGAARTHVYIAGRYDRAALEAALRRAFGGWQAGPAPTEDPPATSTDLQLELVERPDAPQSSLRMVVAAAGPAHEDYFPFTVMNTLLGGAATSRIAANIREDKGYTYSPDSYISARRRSTLWVMSADVATEHTADSLREIYAEIGRLRETPPSAAELDAIKNYRAGLFVVSNSSPDGMLGQLAFMDLHGLADAYLNEWVRNVYAVTPEQVSEMVRKWIMPERMSVVVVGDLGKVATSVRELPQLEGARQAARN
jgi:predicted Zn-dependent peptidase